MSIESFEQRSGIAITVVATLAEAWSAVDGDGSYISTLVSHAVLLALTAGLIEAADKPNIVVISDRRSGLR